MANYVAPVTGTWAAKGSSPFKAARSGGTRYHAGNDLQAKNGTPAVAVIGGTVQYAGHNDGYQWNAVVLGDDGNAYRYATHGPLSVKEGQRIEQGQQVGSIGRGHLHFEVIPPTSTAYKEMAANPGQFVKTSYYPGGKASTIDPAEFFGATVGQTVAAGQPLSGAPQNAQSAIASLVAPSGGPAIPDMPTAAMGYAPNLPGLEPPAPPMPQVASVATPPLPVPPPSWASAGGFPIDEALTGASAQDVLAGGPRTDPRRIAPASAPIAPDMGSMRSPADVLAAGPRLRPGGAPDASMVPDPLSRLASGVLPPPPLSPAMPNPPMRPGGAPDAGLVPTPPARASGLPNPPPRPDINDPALSFNRQSGRGPDMRGGLPPPPSLVAGRPEMPGAVPPASLAGGMSAAMGNAPPPAPRGPYDDWTRAFDTPGPITMANEGMSAFEGHKPVTPPQPVTPPIGNLNYDSLPPLPALAEARTKDDAFTPPSGPFFGSVDPSRSLPPMWSPATSFPPPAPPVGTVAAGSTGGEFFTPAPPMLAPPPAISQSMRDQFDVAFSPGGPGQIMDLQSAFDRRNAPPTMNAQDGINSVFGAPPVQAAPSNLAIPFAEVPGFDAGRFAGSSEAETPARPMPAHQWASAMPDTFLPPDEVSRLDPYAGAYGRPTAPLSPPIGPTAAAAATVASPLPMPAPPSPIGMTDFNARFGGGSVVKPPPAASPAVIDQWTAQNAGPIDIRPPAQGGPPFTPPAVTAPSTPPRQTNTGAERQKQGLALRILGSVLGGPMGGGILGGGLGGSATFTPFGGGMMTTPMGSFRTSGTSAYGNNGGTTNWQSGTSNALGGTNALSWTGSKGQPVTAVENPWSPGTYFTA